ncbi:MAG: hypothetical protein H7Y20_15085 [Bryobacteraceae bacterium]|nr:hypothetical protein [Bryobacteraceae bacterium]
MLRAGGGIFSNQPIPALIETMGQNPRPNAAGQSFIADPQTPNLSLSDPFNPASRAPRSTLADVFGVSKELPDATVYSWGFTVQQQLGGSTVVEAAYHGSRTQNDFVAVSINDAVPGTGNRQARRPYPQFQNIQFLLGAADASYQGFDVSVRHLPTRSGLLLQAEYSMGVVLDQSGGRASTPGDPFLVSSNVSLASNRARGEAHNPGRFTAVGAYDLPFGKGKPLASRGLLANLVGGWSVSGLFTLWTGPYITPSVQFRQA